ncbi:MAG TPA: ATP-binding protein [Polyangiaceae bacterium]|nr:ATP-binding protein [Polyangiaceae bacterium]
MAAPSTSIRSLLQKLGPYVIALAVVAVSAAAAWAALPYSDLADGAMIHLLAIVLLATRFDLRVSLLACVVSIVTFDYLCIPPRFALQWADPKSSLTFVAMVVVTVSINALNERLRQQERNARETAFRAEALHRLNLELSVASEPEHLAAVTSRHLETLFAAQVTVLLQTTPGRALERVAVDAQELEHAERAWARREMVGQTVVSGTMIWVPLVGIHECLGVIGLRVARSFDKESKTGRLLTACANQLATAIERAQLSSAVHRTQLEAEAERLRSSLLSAVSHDLKTPLSSIIAAATALATRRAEMEPEVIEQLISGVVSEGERLHRLIQNLLSITRLESPTIQLRPTPEAVEDIVAAVLRRLETRLGGRQVQADLEADLPLVMVEPMLIEQVLANLLENAVSYAGSDANIRVAARHQAGSLVLQVLDDGPGIAESERQKVFEKFYRGRASQQRDGGAGLGLTICRAIVRAHNGRIAVRERPGGGTLVEFTLPSLLGLGHRGIEAARMVLQ